SIYDRQMTRISGTGSHGQAVTTSQSRRRPERPDSLAVAPQGIACCEGPPRAGVMRLRCVDRERCAAPSSRQRARPPDGHPLRYAGLAALIGLMCVAAAFAALTTLAGQHPL